MSVSVAGYKNFVGGRARGGRRRRNHGSPEPGDGRSDRRGAPRHAGGRRPGGRVGEEGDGGLAGLDPGRAPGGCSCSWPPPSRSTPRSLPRRSRRTSASRFPTPGTRFRSARQPALLCGRGPLPRRPCGRRVPGGIHLDGPPRAGRRRRPDRAVELPAHDGHLEDRSCACSRKRHDSEALGADSDYITDARGVRARRSSLLESSTSSPVTESRSVRASFAIRTSGWSR